MGAIITIFLVVFLVILFLAILLAIFGKSDIGDAESNGGKPTRRKRKSTTRSKKKPSDIPTFHELSQRAKTITGYKSLVRKYEQIEDKCCENPDDEKYAQLYKAYHDALKIFSDRVFHYQYVPYVDLSTSLIELRHAYKIFKPNDIKKIKEEVRSEDPLDWIEVTASDLSDGGELNDYLEPAPDHLNDLIRFREIVEQDISLDDKHAGISLLVKSNKKLKEEFFYDEDPIEQQTLSWLLSSYKIPLFNLLYENGYDTPGKIMNLTLEELKGLKGFGSKKTEKFLTSVRLLKGNKSKWINSR